MSWMDAWATAEVRGLDPLTNASHAPPRAAFESAVQQPPVPLAYQIPPHSPRYSAAADRLVRRRASDELSLDESVPDRLAASDLPYDPDRLPVPQPPFRRESRVVPPQPYLVRRDEPTYVEARPLGETAQPTAEEVVDELRRSPPILSSPETSYYLSQRKIFGPGPSYRSPTAVQRGGDADAAHAAGPPSDAPPLREAVHEHRKELRREGRSALSSVLDGSGSGALPKGSLCELLTRSGGGGSGSISGSVKRRFQVVAEWGTSGPCAVLSLPDRPLVRGGKDGWEDCIPCSHLRRAGFAGVECDTLLLSTNLDTWQIRMSGSAAEKWLAVIYAYCHWLRPSPASMAAIASAAAAADPWDPPSFVTRVSAGTQLQGGASRATEENILSSLLL
eukprot:Rhum_TRINITY_DN14638_c17_g1::Rhum_TRINITY_DN14638_c17_g1_i1::g.105603::m.105603